MTEISPSLSLPFLAPAQAQKHVTVNEALARLDIVVQIVVTAFDAVTPPGVPVAGMVYALGAGASDAWAGQDGRLAAYADGAWVFVTPRAGWIATQSDSGALRVYRDDSWQTPELAHDSLDGVGIHASADATNRLVVRAPASLFTGDGGGHQVKVNKDAASDTASLLFQSAYSGRAEMGLAGTESFSVKVSSDGATWRTALQVDGATGAVGLGPQADTSQQLSVVANATEPTIMVRNAGGNGGATFRMIDDLSGGDWKFKTTSDASFRLRDQASGVDQIYMQKTTRCTEFAGAVRPASYSVATLPDAAVLGAGSLIHVTDESGGPVPAFSDGTAWRRITDRAVVS